MSKSIGRNVGLTIARFSLMKDAVYSFCSIGFETQVSVLPALNLKVRYIIYIIVEEYSNL
jgi:hypothetical protein